MTRGYELLTVSDAARELMKSENAVRRLIKAGKLGAIREGGRYLLTPEEIGRYAGTLPHPMPVMAALYDARQILAYDRLSKKTWPALRHDPRYRLSAGNFDTYFMTEAVPVCAGIVEAVGARDYGRVEALRLDLYRVRVDYQILYAPLPTPQSEAREKAEAGALMPPLFPDLGTAGGQG
ncbi:helix-turn-helix domain-containing protein [Deinococcus arenicola]|uniref:Helix-turn-helix domain-containing protein n=1 Tax=Deinococcus arenicola TaxID=2994950 RepID=A0ABU4DUJ6_9DEIO|nr:helix-turn-helix domain-containing protein [Deinococcus sp. ZS9-10]MDV6376092.1 helix-turn-helix domain-containing protein [Deinococcus sp. ZS9-10]